MKYTIVCKVIHTQDGKRVIDFESATVEAYNPSIAIGDAVRQIRQAVNDKGLQNPMVKPYQCVPAN